MANLDKKKFQKSQSAMPDLDTAMTWEDQEAPASVEAALDQLKTSVNKLLCYKPEDDCGWEKLPTCWQEAADSLCREIDKLKVYCALSQIDGTKWASQPTSIASAIDRLAAEVNTLKGGTIA